MAVYLTSEITVGKFTWTGVCGVKINKSIHSCRDTATITLPATVSVSKENKPSDVRTTDAAILFYAGDPVTIKLGYDGDNKEEFKGFVNRHDLSEPFVLECEGYSYQLRRTAIISKQYPDIQLRTLLETLLKGTIITIHPDTPKDARLTGFTINYTNSYDTLEMLCRTNVFVAYFIGGNQLYVGIKDGAQKNLSTKYWLGWNTVKDDSLKYRKPEDTKVFISCTYKDEKGKTHHITSGEQGGQQVSFNCQQATAAQAQEMAARKAEDYLYEGYEGTLKTPLLPYTQPGWKANIQTAEFAAHTGNYLIESVAIEFGSGGGWRTVEIGKKVG